jgi:hypothetical protein
MRTKPFIFMLTVCLLAALPAVLAAQHLQEQIPLDSPAYRLLDALLLEAGKVPNSTARPYTVAQFRQMLAQVDPAGLSEAGLANYHRLDAGIGSAGLLTLDQFSFATGASGGLAWYGQTNPADDLRAKDYGQRQNLLSVPLSFGLGDLAYMHGMVDIREEYFAVPKDAVNIPGDIGWFDLQFPFTAYISLGDPHLNLTLGRSRLDVGPGSFSNLLISTQPDFLDYLSFRAAWDPFVYTAWVIGLDPSLLPGQSDGPDAVRTFYLHRFETSLFANRLNIGVTEGLMTGGLQPELKDFNPITIYHNFMDWTHASSILSIEVTVNPWKYCRAYGQFIFTRVPVDYEQRVYGDTENPFGRGYLLGTEAQIPLGSGYLGLTAEFYYTDPFLYVRETPYTSYAWHRRVLSNVLGSGATAVVSKPLGYAYGTDAYNVYAALSYEMTDQLWAILSGNWATLGQNGIDSAFQRGDAAVKMTTPTGVPEYRFELALDAQWRLLEWLKLSGGLSLFWRQNANHAAGQEIVDVQPYLGVEFSVGQDATGLRD